jgi:two-component system response regulator AdeR
MGVGHKTGQVGTPSVLIVDDEPDILDTYSAWLSGEYDVETASGGKEALEKIDPNISVVFLDRRMPDMLGREVLKKIRDRQDSPRVAMVTAVEPDFDIVSMGFDDYLLKPVTKSDIIDTAELLLERTRYTEVVTEYHSLVSKKVLLEQKKSDQELAGSDEYRALLKKIDGVQEKADKLSEEMSSTDFEAVARDIQDFA